VSREVAQQVDGEFRQASPTGRKVGSHQPACLFFWDDTAGVLSVIANCVRCGKPMAQNEGRGRKRKYCSEKCKSASKTDAHRVPRTCRACGKQFGSYRGKNEYCSKSCKAKAQQEKRVMTACRHCGWSFAGAVGQKYCSDGCRVAYYQAHPRYQKTCPVCREQFTTNDKAQTYCSVDCILAESRRAACTCRHCGKEFYPKRPSATTYCSRECSFADKASAMSVHRKGKSVWRFGESDARHHRRAKHYGVAYERIKPMDVYERDGWQCQICGKAVSQGLRWPHPMCASLDHIMPLSVGGRHDEANVRLAHLRCNTRRGARADGAQLKLMG
jgi:hypothetical protein